MSKSPTYKIVLCAVLSTFALITFVLEGLFPPLFLPGARMGLSNVFILLVAIFLGFKYAYVSLTVKIFLGSLFAGNISTVMYSLPAGLISLSIEGILLLFVKKISLPAISVAGAMINVTVQNLVFCLVTQTMEYLSYLPYLALISVFSGLIVGFTVYFIVKKTPINIENNMKISEGE